MVAILHFVCYHEQSSYWFVLRCLQGALAGLVAISSGADVYSPIIAFAIAAVLAMVFYLASEVVQRICIEDNANIIAIHFVCSFFGALTPPLLGRRENLGSSVRFYMRTVHLVWQIMCTLAIFGLFAVFSVVFFLLFSCCKLLRNRGETINHRRAVLAYKNSGKKRRCGITRLFKIRAGTKYIEPELSRGFPERLELDEPLPRTTRNKNDERIQQEAVESRVAETEANVKLVVENDKPDEKYIHQSVKRRFVYTMVNIHNPGDGNHDDGLNGGGGDILNLKQKPNQSDIFGGKGMVRKKSHYKLHRTKKCTNLLSRQDVRKERAEEDMDTNKHINLTRSPECILYDEKFNDGFVTFKKPAEMSDLSDDSTL